MNTLDFNILISNITSLDEMNFWPLVKVSIIVPTPPFILAIKKNNVPITPTISTTPCIKSVHKTDFSPPVYE